MNSLLLIPLIVAVILALVAWVTSRPRGKQLRALGNVAAGRWPGKRGFYSDAAIASRYLLGKIGTDANHIAVCGVNDIPIGVITDEAAAAEELVNVDFLGMEHETKVLSPSGAINADAFVVPAANGQVRTLPAAAGTYYIIGRAVKAAADGEVEVIPCAPIQRIVP